MLVQEGSHQSNTTARLNRTNRAHPGQTAQARAAANAVQDGLGVVVGVMGDRHEIASGLERSAFKKVVSQSPRNLFGRSALGGDDRGDIDLFMDETQAQALGLIAYKRLFVVGGRAAHCVIQVGDVQGPM
jgi:hypothetical protein